MGVGNMGWSVGNLYRLYSKGAFLNNYLLLFVYLKIQTHVTLISNLIVGIFNSIPFGKRGDKRSFWFWHLNLRIKILSIINEL